MSSSSIKECTSAGGLLLRRVQGKLLVVVVERTEGIESKWAPVLRQLPKGGAELRESLEQTALREVKEETGFAAEVLAFAGTTQWSYRRNDELWRETVHYFLLRPLSLVPEQHDQEFQSVCWIPMDEAAKSLSYPEERRLLTSLIDGALIDSLSDQNIG